MRGKTRAVVVLLATLLAVGMMAGPAAAHYLVVDPPGQDEAQVQWVGGPALPDATLGNEALAVVGGGPDAGRMQSPAHEKGLNTACERMREQGRSAADIFGPPGPPMVPTSGCPHGQ
ncbi:hypothetical protein ER308_08505 [Egibacter rhizosphaerae]|uniref:DUF4198 domain-containing protein n=1 Tax=Egibacter rhizosphaerae TaxID=1670831 RepID=A0A411YES0_9ACTN|nr:hypothetical protein [Egibacter rhizosphaerae]QBI19587.1 hypothetical protein ER308_08505 [Egibacter rhizosphaerae]